MLLGFGIAPGGTNMLAGATRVPRLWRISFMHRGALLPTILAQASHVGWVKGAAVGQRQGTPYTRLARCFPASAMHAVARFGTELHGCDVKGLACSGKRSAWGAFQCFQLARF